MSKQNNLERIVDHLQQGLITADQANVNLVRSERVRIVSKLRSDVRKALNEAVKTGELGHIKKEGKLPEVYFHPTFKYMAVAARKKHEQETIEALMKISGWGND